MRARRARALPFRGRALLAADKLAVRSARAASLLALVACAAAVMPPARWLSPRPSRRRRAPARRGVPAKIFLSRPRPTPVGVRWNCRGDSADLGFGRRPVRMAVESPRWKFPGKTDAARGDRAAPAGPRPQRTRRASARYRERSREESTRLPELLAAALAELPDGAITAASDADAWPAAAAARARRGCRRCEPFDPMMVLRRAG